jgi:hypothetical protein
VHLFAFTTLTVTGFVACAEFGSYAFVHPVLRRLDPAPRIAVEMGLLKTFGRVMPVGMTVAPALAVISASTGNSWWYWPAATALTAALVFTLVVNVPINIATGGWDPEHPPRDWERTRRRWEFFQAIRSWLLLTGFVLVCAAITT